MKTLGEFIVEKQQDFSHATGELTALLSAIKLGAFNIPCECIMPSDVRIISDIFGYDIW